MALLIGLTIRFPSNLMRALVATAFLAIGLIFGLIWNAALGKSQFLRPTPWSSFGPLSIWPLSAG